MTAKLKKLFEIPKSLSVESLYTHHENNSSPTPSGRQRNRAAKARLLTTLEDLADQGVREQR